MLWSWKRSGGGSGGAGIVAVVVATRVCRVGQMLLVINTRTDKYGIVMGSDIGRGRWARLWLRRVVGEFLGGLWWCG